MFSTLLVRQNDHFVAQDSSRRFAKETFPTANSHVIFGARNPEHAPLREFEQMPVIDVSLVEKDDFAALEPGAQFSGSFTVALASRIDYGEPWQKRL